MLFNRQNALLLAFVCVGLLTVPLLQAEQDREAPEKPVKVAVPAKQPENILPKLSPEEERNRLFRKDVILMSNEVLEKVQKHYPNLAEKLDSKDKVKILSSLVKTLNCGLEYCPAGSEKPKRKKTNLKADPYPAIIIAAHQVLYARMDNFSPESVQQLKADLISSFRLANPPSGLILDLRNSQGYQEKEVLKALGLFVKKGKLLLPKNFTAFERVVKTPILILIGEQTTGAGELFTLLITKFGQAMPLGEATAGSPFIKEVVPLSNGDFLKVPTVPRFLSSVKPIAAIPAIKTQTYPQIDFKKLREEVGSEIKDNCIQRAVELIICLQALTPEAKPNN